jgi:hypothetical protein
MNKKSQIIGEVFKYGLILIFSAAVLFAGYKVINVLRNSSCNTEFSEFEISLKGLDKEVRYGTKEMRSFQTPCDVEQILFFDHSKEINSGFFSDIPLLEEAVKNKTRDNVFLIKNGDIASAFYAGNINMNDPNYICFVPKFGKIAFSIEGKGTSVFVDPDKSQPDCTFRQVVTTNEEATDIANEGKEVCSDCQSEEAEPQKQTAEANSNTHRQFTFSNKKTKVVIIVKAREGITLRNFVYYESIPKDCINDLRNFLEEKTDSGARVIVKNDPMIIWKFDELKGQKKVSYTLNKEISKPCQDAFKGLSVTQSITGVNQQQINTNTNRD